MKENHPGQAYFDEVCFTTFNSNNAFYKVFDCEGGVNTTILNLHILGTEGFWYKEEPRF